MRGKQYKIWLGVAQPMMFQGMTVDYFQFAIILTFFFYILTGASEWVFVTVIPAALTIGYIKSRKDKRWFKVIKNALFHFGVSAFRRTRYVK